MLDWFAPRRFSTCALVGNGASLLKTPAGAAIDSHEAVFRFNDLMWFACHDPSHPNYGANPPPFLR
eukprot:7457259-Pyramimonas_sp.AAC.1